MACFLRTESSSLWKQATANEIQDDQRSDCRTPVKRLIGRRHLIEVQSSNTIDRQQHERLYYHQRRRHERSRVSIVTARKSTGPVHLHLLCLSFSPTLLHGIILSRRSTLVMFRFWTRLQPTRSPWLRRHFRALFQLFYVFIFYMLPSI